MLPVQFVTLYKTCKPKPKTYTTEVQCRGKCVAVGSRLKGNVAELGVVWSGPAVVLGEVEIAASPWVALWKGAKQVSQCQSSTDF